MLDKFLNNLISIDIPEMTDGFLWDSASKSYCCLFCEQKYEDGVIFKVNDKLLTAKRAVRQHVADDHGDVFNLLLDLGKGHTGLSDVQQTVLQLAYKGYSDKQIASAMGGKSTSTIRNHRFLLRKKKNAAKLFLAIMHLFEKSDIKKEDFMELHTDYLAGDEQIVITNEEASKVKNSFFKKGPKLELISMPRKQKAKLIVLNLIAELFERDRNYTEKEVNEILIRVYEDYTTIRRYLVDFRFFDREPGGGQYWLSKYRIKPLTD